MKLPPLLRRRSNQLTVPRSERIAEHLKRFHGRWHVVHEPSPLRWPPPRELRPSGFAFALPERSAEYGVLELADGRVYGRHGWVLGSNGAVLPELSWFGAASDRIRVPVRLPEPVHLEGACLSLVSDWSCRNYSHFLLDGLGRLALFFAAGFTFADVDHVYCPTPPTPVTTGYLDRLGIPPQKRVAATPQRLVRAERMLVPSLPATQLTYPGWLADFLRRALGPAGTTRSNRRLYVSRSGYGREAVREREVESLLLEYGFEIYRGVEHDDQPRDFAEAELVVGPHGAGLANLAFCRPGTRVIEILPTDNAHPFYYSLAVAAGIDYSYLLGRSVANRDSDAFGPSPYDFDVNLEDLRVAIA